MVGADVSRLSTATCLSRRWGTRVSLTEFYTCCVLSLEPTSAFAGPVPRFSPIALGSTCNGRTPIYRFYNNRAAQNDTNHRYTDDLAAYLAMQAKGWTMEGIRLCALR